MLSVVLFAALLVAHHFRSQPAAAARVTRPRAPTSYSVGSTTCTFVDDSRDTHDYATGATIPGRTLVTDVYYPTTATSSARVLPHAIPARRFGPFPMVVFAHGYDLSPTSYMALLERWVAAGDVVAAPVFPDTNATTVGDEGNISAPESDIVNQPGDVAFVTRELLAADADGSGCAVVTHLVDARKVALAGQSDGATTVAALAYSGAYSVPGVHYVAVAALSGSQLAAPGAGASSVYRATPGDPALLVVQSATDQCNPPQSSVLLYSAVDQADRWFLTLKAADHLPPYTDVPPNADFGVVAAVTTRFFAEAFSGAIATKRLAAVGDVVGTSQLSTGQAPDLPSLEGDPATCYVS